MPILRTRPVFLTGNRLAGGALRKYSGANESHLLLQAVTREFQLNETDAADTFLYSAGPTTNMGTVVTFNVGESNAETSVSRTLIKAPLGQLDAERVASITACYLDLTINLDRSSTARDFKMYRVLRDWVESQATWNIFSTGNNWGTAGCGDTTTDYNNTVLATTNFTATEAIGTVKRFSLDTTVVYDMLQGVYSDYGFLIKADTEANDAWIFNSSGAAFEIQRPLWTIETLEAS